jgi:uncharacterized protein YjbJ (UPF0337 family)
MNTNQAKGVAKDAEGKIRRTVAGVTDDKSEQIKGAAQQVKGKAQKALGDVQEALSDADDKTSTPRTRP